jgi:hypothetical protein
VPVALPAEFVGDRIYVDPRTTSGDDLRLYTDTGGAMLLFASAVERLGLPVDTCSIDGDDIKVVSLPSFDRGASIPDIDRSADVRDVALRGRLIVMADGGHFTDADGLLGQAWFAGRVWTFDYPGERLLLDEASRPPGDHTVPLGFPRESDGRPAGHFPTIEATIDGEAFAFLFDTGATLHLTDDAMRALDDGRPKQRATCFIVGSVFDRWRKKHPKWRVLERADQNVSREPAIEVPSVDIAGHSVGPVWFTRRPDTNFHDWMSQWLDRRVDGALGGSLFRYFVVTADYPNATATFERVDA